MFVVVFVLFSFSKSKFEAFDRVSSGLYSHFSRNLVQSRPALRKKFMAISVQPLENYYRVYNLISS